MDELPTIYLRCGQNRVGPLDVASLKEQIRQKKLKKSDKVANAEFGPWYSLGEVLQPLLANGGWIPDSAGEGEPDDEAVEEIPWGDLHAVAEQADVPSFVQPVGLAPNTAATHSDVPRSRDEEALAQYASTALDTDTKTAKRGWDLSDGLTWRQTIVTLTVLVLAGPILAAAFCLTTNDTQYIPAVSIFLALCFVVNGSLWIIFEKASIPGWHSLVPVLRTLYLLEMADLGKQWVVVYIAPSTIMAIRFLLLLNAPRSSNVLVFAAFGAIFNLAFIFVNMVVHYRLAKVFSGGKALTVGLVLLGAFCWPILAFGKYRV